MTTYDENFVDADVVIAASAPGIYTVWADNGVIGNVRAPARVLIEMGAAMLNLSVYDADKSQYVTGTLDKLFSDGDA